MTNPFSGTPRDMDVDICISNLPRKVRDGLLTRTSEGKFETNSTMDVVQKAVTVLNSMKSQFEGLSYLRRSDTTESNQQTVAGSDLDVTQRSPQRTLVPPSRGGGQFRGSRKSCTPGGMVRGSSANRPSSTYNGDARNQRMMKVLNIVMPENKDLSLSPKRYQPNTEQTVGSAPSWETTLNGTVPTRDLVSERKKEIEYLKFWGEVDSLKDVALRKNEETCILVSENLLLTSQAEIAEQQQGFAQRHVGDLSRVLLKERAQHEQGIQWAEDKCSILREENDRFVGKQNDMRRIVSAAEGAVQKMKLDTDVTMREAGKLRAEVEKQNILHAMEVLELKREVQAAKYSGMSEEKRLEMLEDQNRKLSDRLQILVKTVEVLTSENQTLNGKVHAAKISENLQKVRKHPQATISGAAVDLQQSTQKSFQKREAELVQNLSSSRKKGERQEFQLRSMKEFIDVQFRVHERLLMAAFDADSVSGLSIQGQCKAAAVLRLRDGGERIHIKLYDATSLQFLKHLSRDLEGVRLSGRVVDSNYATVVDIYRDGAYQQATEAQDCFAKVIGALWTFYCKLVPADPLGTSDGVRELFHAELDVTIQKGCTAVQRIARNHVKALQQWMDTEELMLERLEDAKIANQKEEAKRGQVLEKKLHDVEVELSLMEQKIVDADALTKSVEAELSTFKGQACKQVASSMRSLGWKQEVTMEPPTAQDTFATIAFKEISSAIGSLVNGAQCYHREHTQQSLQREENFKKISEQAAEHHEKQVSLLRADAEAATKLIHNQHQKEINLLKQEQGNALKQSHAEAQKMVQQSQVAASNALGEAKSVLERAAKAEQKVKEAEVEIIEIRRNLSIVTEKCSDLEKKLTTLQRKPMTNEIGLQVNFKAALRFAEVQTDPPPRVVPIVRPETRDVSVLVVPAVPIPTPLKVENKWVQTEPVAISLNAEVKAEMEDGVVVRPPIKLVEVPLDQEKSVVNAPREAHHIHDGKEVSPWSRPGSAIDLGTSPNSGETRTVHRKSSDRQQTPVHLRSIQKNIEQPETQAPSSLFPLDNHYRGNNAVGFSNFLATIRQRRTPSALAKKLDEDQPVDYSSYNRAMLGFSAKQLEIPGRIRPLGSPFKTRAVFYPHSTLPVIDNGFQLRDRSFQCVIDGSGHLVKLKNNARLPSPVDVARMRVISPSRRAPELPGSTLLISVHPSIKRVPPSAPTNEWNVTVSY